VVPFLFIGLELSEKVRDLATNLKLKTAGIIFATEANHLSSQTSRLCDNVAKLHADVPLNQTPPKQRSLTQKPSIRKKSRSNVKITNFVRTSKTFSKPCSCG
jgi:hypothetical protein